MGNSGSNGCSIENFHIFNAAYRCHACLRRHATHLCRLFAGNDTGRSGAMAGVGHLGRERVLWVSISIDDVESPSHIQHLVSQLIMLRDPGVWLPYHNAIATTHGPRIGYPGNL
ncbi:hypothetical protein D3C76_1319190 [compost metagenome]